MQSQRNPLGPGTAEQELERIMQQNARVEKALKAVRDERDRLDRLIAEAVSAEPTSETWYAKPGVLTIDQAVSVITGGYTALHRALERYRKAEKPKRAAKGGRR